MPRKKQELTDDQQIRICQFRDEGMTNVQIAKELHTSPNKIQDYLKSIGRNKDLNVNKGVNLKSKVDINVIYRMFTDGISDDGIVGRLNDTYTLDHIHKLRKQYFDEGQPGAVPPEYDLTTRTVNENSALINEILKSSPLLMDNVHMFANSEIEIGGERTLWRMEEDGTLMYDKVEQWPMERHLFDIVIPDIRMVIVPLDNMDDIKAWKGMLGNKKDPNIQNLSWFSLMMVVAKYEILYGTDPLELANRLVSRYKELEQKKRIKGKKNMVEGFESCTGCSFSKECPHTYCKARGEKEKPPLDIKSLQEKKYRGVIKGKEEVVDWSNEVVDKFSGINGEEYKFWDERGRIGKGDRRPLTDEELKEITGKKSLQEVQADVSVRMSGYNQKDTHWME